MMQPLANNAEANRSYKNLSDEEVMLRVLLFWTMKNGSSAKFLKAVEHLKGRSKAVDVALTHMLKRTAIRVFFGGETLEEAIATSRVLMQKGTGVILDYAAPENVSNYPPEHFLVEVPAEYHRMTDACAQLKQEMPEGKIAIAMKVSTLGDVHDLERLNSELKEVGMDASKLTNESRRQFDSLQERFESIMRHANETGVKAYVDAEQTALNPLIRKLCYDALDKGLPLSMTVQAYLKETDDVVDEILAREKAGKAVPSIKLVRGAYIHKGIEDQFIHGDGKDGGKELTDACYDRSFEKLYGHVPEITLATHNQASLDKASALVAEKRLNTTVTDSATLQGMGEGMKIGFDMGKGKYIPYTGKGNVLEAVPYTERRGTEFAKTMLPDGRTRGQTEFDLAWDEMKLRKGKFFALWKLKKDIFSEKAMLGTLVKEVLFAAGDHLFGAEEIDKLIGYPRAAYQNR